MVDRRCESEEGDNWAKALRTDVRGRIVGDWRTVMERL